ncbi:DUF5071 domain-containing protein [Paenibacillus sp. HW567]|uniref:DUF5071 domain-containing protein n=1 Tax=Paenibacillus sp. HW567 TaxID=1034769 RepID=UPI00037AB506|nr:DUF5071 domain-containing protein [Paenibacillus sp. HW567]
MDHPNLPRDKHDNKSVEILSRSEGSVVIPLLPELLTWVQDMNWPIAIEVVEILLKYRIETIPHVKMILSQNDTGWINNILRYLISEWDTEFVSRLSASLQELAQTMDNYEDTDLLSIEILNTHRLIETNEAVALLVRKQSETKGYLENFTAEQKVIFLELENERLDILNTEGKRIVNYVKENSESLNQKYQYENLLRRQQEIEVRIKNL